MNRKVLVVDDQQGIRRLLEEACSLLGYQAVTVATGLEALKLIHEHDFKVALVDFQMPGLNGIETLEKMRDLAPEIKGILMTGFGENCITEGLSTGIIYDVLHKPFDIDHVEALLAKAYK